jgi:hypothetical protein
LTPAFSLLPEPAGETSERDESRRIWGFPRPDSFRARSSGTSGVGQPLSQVPNLLFNAMADADI